MADSDYGVYSLDFIYKFGLFLARGGKSAQHDGGLAVYILKNLNLLANCSVDDNEDNNNITDYSSSSSLLFQNCTKKLSIDTSSLNIRQELMKNQFSQSVYMGPLVIGILFFIFMLIILLLACIFGICLRGNKSSRSAKQLLRGKLSKVRKSIHKSRSCGTSLIAKRAEADGVGADDHDQSTSSSKNKLKIYAINFLSFLPLILFFCCFIGLIISIVNLRSALLTNPPNGNDANNGVVGSSASSKAVLPLLHNSLAEFKQFAQLFLNDTLQRTQPIVLEMINATLKMQKESSIAFQGILQKELGSTTSMELGKRMTKFLITLVNHTEYLSQPASDAINPLITKSIGSIVTLQNLLGKINRANLTVNINNAIDDLLDMKLIDQTSANPLTFDFASLVQLMLVIKEKKTVEKIKEDGEYGEKKMAEKNREMDKKSAERMDVPGTITKSIQQSWIDLGEKLMNASYKIGEMQDKLSSTALPMINAKWKNLAFLWVFLCICICFVLLIAIITVCLTSPTLLASTGVGDIVKRSRSLLIASYFGGFFALSLVLIFATILYLGTALLETQACIHLRPTFTEPLQFPHSYKIVDVALNEFLDRSWPAIKSISPQPLPKPFNILHGISDLCRDNVGLFTALGVLHQLDLKSLSKPEISERFLRIGRELMVESLNETNPTEMMAPGTVESLAKAGDLTKFNRNYQEPRDEVKNMYFIQRKSTAENVSIPEYQQRLQTIQPYVIDNLELISVINNFNETLTSMENIRNRCIEDLEGLMGLEEIGPVVKQLQNVIPQLIKQLEDKENLIALGNRLYDQHVVATSEEKSQSLTANFTPRLMKAVAPCRPIYETYISSVRAVCHVTLFPLVGLWFFLGCAWLTGILVLIMNWFLLPPVSPVAFASNDKAQPTDAKDEAELADFT